MSIYISDTARSFPNIDDGKEYQKTWQRPSGNYESYQHHSGPGTNYRITFDDDGPGGSVFGQDRVFYIGDNDESCFIPGVGQIDECDFFRQPIYRWFRGGEDNRDHKYTPRSALRWPADFTGEQTGKGSGVAKKYNREPRRGDPVFYVSRNDKGSYTNPLNHWYNNDLNDTWLTTSGSSPGSGYVFIETIGHVYSSLSNANVYSESGETAVPLYEYYRPSSSRKRDHFYTANPATEVNLQTGIAGVPDCKDPRGEEYQYVGIVGYVFLSDSDSGNRKIYQDVGIIGPTGYGAPVSYATRASWYDWEQPDLAGHYLFPATTPGIFTHENYEYQFDADAGPLRAYDQYGMLSTAVTNFRNSLYRLKTYSITSHPDSRWGNPDYCEILNTDALFEWAYGKAGAVKGSVPKYLEFHSAFDSQFVYYIFDTSYPWKGPIFSVQYSISDRNQCPNRAHNDPSGIPALRRCVCDESLVTKEYFSHFYEIREDSWKTTQTKLQLTDFSNDTVQNSFKPVDTESKTILFRYTSGGVDRFKAGDIINGWEVAEYAYFGNKLRCGYMELQGKGKAFTAGQVFTPAGRDAASIEVLAGYGIKDKAGFFGVYEFPKKLSYYKVEIDSSALVHQRTIDQAELSCTVDEDGRIESVIIDNAGFGYKNPVAHIQEPTLLSEYGAMDMAREVAQQFEFDAPKFRSPTNKLENYDGEDLNFGFKRIQKNTQAVLRDNYESNMQERRDEYPYANNSEIKIEGSDKNKNKKVLQRLKIKDKQLRVSSSESRRKGKMKPAVIEITKVNKDGSIVEVLIKDRGRGYDTNPNNPPKIFVVEVENEQYKMRGPNTTQAQSAVANTFNPNSNKQDYKIEGQGTVTANRQTLKDVLKGKVKEGDDIDGFLSVMEDGTIGSFKTMMNGFNATYPTGYIKIGEVDDVEVTSLCSNLPSTCVQIKFPQLVSGSLFTGKDVKNITAHSEQFKDMMSTQYPLIQSAAAESDNTAGRLSSFFGWNNGQECINIPQPKFYNVTRFVDLPCPYIDEETGRAFGWIVYKYCGSTADDANLKINLSIRGKTTGPSGEDFMDFLHGLPRPTLTEPRPVVVGDKRKCWKCRRSLAGGGQVVEGRCYWDPSGGNDIVFVPVGLEENTFDWQRSGFSELDQLGVWLGDNLFSYRTRSDTYTVPSSSSTDPNTGQTTTTPGGTFTNPSFYTASIERLQNGMPKYECWDTYVKRTGGNGNSNGVLDVYSAYYVDGSGQNNTQGRTNGETFWEAQIYQGYPVTATCFFGVSYLYALLFGFGGATAANTNEFALEYVNDLSISIDPQVMDQFGIKMGPYSGVLGIKNWSAGSAMVFGQTAKQMGNPFFDECSGGVFANRIEVINANPPIQQRKIHNSSYDPGDKKLLRKQYSSAKDIEFTDDTWKEFYDADFDYQDEVNTTISDFSTDVDNLFNG